MHGRLKTKADRLNYLESEFNSLTKKGYTKELYKDLTIFSQFGNESYLKVFCGTSTKPLCYYRYKDKARMTARIQEFKNSSDIREKRKTDEKGNQKISSHAAAAKAIREELKKEFDGVKFSVKSDSFSMGNSVRISWTDGPTKEGVRNITNKYQYGHFDGMTDMYESSNNIDDIPQAKYVSEDRTVSEEIRKKVKDLINNDYKDLVDHELSRIYWEFMSKQSIPCDATEVRIERDPEFTCGLAGEAYRFVFTLPESKGEKTSPSFEKIEVTEGQINVIEYNEKAIAVIGDTKPIKDKLKALGGRFNFRLSCGPGWIFPKSKMEELKECFN